MTATELSYHEARTRAVGRELDANRDALLIGASLSLPFNSDDGLLARWPDQVLLPPYSELATAAAGVGAAIGGLRPLVALSTSSFMFYAWPAIANEAPLVRYLSGGRASAPVAFHVHAGSRRAGGPQHEHTPQAMLQNVPGIRVLTPGTPADIDAALHEAFTGPDPVVIFDHLGLADSRGPVPSAPAGLAPRLLCEGDDALLVSSSLMTARSLAAARELEHEGMSVAVLNVAQIAPAPLRELTDAVGSHRNILFVDESRAAGSPSSHFMAALYERRPGVRARLLCTGPVPAPFAPSLLDEVVPTVPRIVSAVQGLIQRERL